jgi:ABC-type amino acid transport substrate-binding protein
MTAWPRLLAVVCLLFAHLCAAAGPVVRFPRPEFEGDHRYDYALELLRLALRESGGGYRIELASIPMNQERQVRELEAGRTIDVAPIPSSAERERRLLPVRIPINRGVLGWRLGLIRAGDARRFADIRSLADLKGVRIAQGKEWPDTQILRANGVDVITAPRYEDLFTMLSGDRFDYFPRSVMEIWDEQDNNAASLEVEPHVALHYPYDAYFMVNRTNTALARAIDAGLERSIKDGAFRQLFQAYYGDRLRRAHLDTRAIIELANPLLTPGTPVDRPELWYDPRREGPGAR